MKQINFAEAEFSGKKRVTRRERFLREIERLVSWPKLIDAIAPHYGKGGKAGRPPIPFERLLRMYLAQQCFALSDAGTEDALYDSQSIRDFVSLDLAREKAPDATTLLHFRHLLEKHRLIAPLLDQEQGSSDQLACRLRSSKRRALPDDEIGRIDEAIEKLKAKVRAKVEHPFQILKNRLGIEKARYRGLLKNTAQLFTLFGIANLLIAKRKLLALDGGDAS